MPHLRYGALPFGMTFSSAFDFALILVNPALSRTCVLTGEARTWRLLPICLPLFVTLTLLPWWNLFSPLAREQVFDLTVRNKLISILYTVVYTILTLISLLLAPFYRRES